MAETYEYKGFIRCGNCGTTNSKFEAEIDKGTDVKSYLKNLECENCGVKGKITN